MVTTLTKSTGGTRLVYDRDEEYHEEIVVAHIVSFEKFNSVQIILNLTMGADHLTFDNTTARDNAYDLIESLFP